MSSVAVAGFQSSPVFVALERALESLTDAQRAAEISQIGGIYEIHLTNSRRQAAIWTIDLKSTGTVLKGSFRTADVVITTSDETFVDIANGRVSPLKAFQTGKLNTRGNIALVNKLDSVLKVCVALSCRPERGSEEESDRGHAGGVNAADVYLIIHVVNAIDPLRINDAV
ncbi:hypothetical protein ONZ51_g1028 [Trametes cubensis]|uniref:SCP2 domain-containing protein n=1 Tax=Trametes cubensis TaxID=1111947 RepID=A0AAD7U2D4_9APHY|nr:hypothetical protein ONZ51_g1028 [Trametes cubensis]